MRDRLLRLGRPLAEFGVGYPPPAAVSRYGEIVNPASAIFTTAPVVTANPGIYGSGAWLGANLPFAIPFLLPRREVVYQLGWYNGTSAGDNADVGLYDASWNRIVSTGSTAATPSSAPQFVDISDTVLAPGTLYYLVMARDTTTSARQRRWNVASAPAVGLVGCYASADASFPLPDPLTNMTLVAATWTTIPEALMALRALV